MLKPSWMASDEPSKLHRACLPPHLIDQLNPKIRGWANYHRHVVSKRTFGRVDHSIFSSLWKWARRGHPNKSPRWFKPKYFAQRGNRDWSFFGETCDDEGQTNKWLYYAKSTPIKRHVKVKGEANPYDPTYETYFEEREGAHMLETFRGTRTLRYLWYQQRGLCTLCNTTITRITGWRLHHCVSRVMGGSAGATNRVLLHPECHDRFIVNVFPFRNRVSYKEAFEGLELGEGKPSRPVLRGRAAARPPGYSVLTALLPVCRRSTRDRKIRTQQPVFYSNGGAASVGGEFCAVNETGAIRRQEDDGLGNLVRCSWTARRRLRGQLLNTLPHGIGAFPARRSRAYCINADTARAIFSRPRFGAYDICFDGLNRASHALFSGDQQGVLKQDVT
jgi:hypothetical protein